jgi:ABC-type lipoprotein release transport system permease subunit
MHFPDNAGSSVFLVEADPRQAQRIGEELKRSFRDYGMEVEPAAARLAEFYSVENTYLSVFLVMGALAILIGTVGLGIILVRSILERETEIALLRAVGLGRKKIMKLILGEYLVLLVTGILAGILASLIATFPSLVSPNTGISLSSLALITVILLVNGMIWISLLAWIYLKDPAISKALRDD